MPAPEKRSRVLGVRPHLTDTDPKYRDRGVGSTYDDSILLSTLGWIWDAVGDITTWLRRRLRRRSTGSQ